MKRTRNPHFPESWRQCATVLPAVAEYNSATQQIFKSALQIFFVFVRVDSWLNGLDGVQYLVIRVHRC